ncbi:hypothetical protein GYMLUDRAFT_157357, partial [Collybiopsis luxurians FD-317 M1]
DHKSPPHFPAMIKVYGPVYDWWLFAFEQFNGMLKKVKSNGHNGGRVELTLLQNWVQTHLIYEYLLALPADVSPEEQDLVDQIIRAEASKAHGYVMTEMAIFHPKVSTNCISLPKYISKTPINLHALNLHAFGPNGEDVYMLLFNHCQDIWPQLHLCRELSMDQGRTFIGNEVAQRIYYIRKNGLSLRLPRRQPGATWGTWVT